MIHTAAWNIAMSTKAKTFSLYWAKSPASSLATSKPASSAKYLNDPVGGPSLIRTRARARNVSRGCTIEEPAYAVLLRGKLLQECGSPLRRIPLPVGDRAEQELASEYCQCSPVIDIVPRRQFSNPEADFGGPR